MRNDARQRQGADDDLLVDWLLLMSVDWELGNIYRIFQLCYYLEVNAEGYQQLY